MPFTLAHPAAVLPIHSRWKRWFALAPLVVGSMVPDAGYFLSLPAYYKTYAHSWLGALTSSIPLGLGILLVLYWLGPALIFLLPNPHREALQGAIGAPVFSLRAAALAVSGILIGAESHVAWDSFTHHDGWLVQRVPALYVIWGIHPYLILQILSSVIGLWFVLHAYDIWAQSAGFRAWTVRGRTWRSFLWLAIVLGCLTEALIESRTVQAIATLSFLHRRHFVLVLITSFIRDLLFVACAIAVGVKLLGRGPGSGAGDAGSAAVGVGASGAETLGHPLGGRRESRGGARSLLRSPYSRGSKKERSWARQ